MFSTFKSTDLGNGYSLVEPPAGLLPDIHKRTKLYADGDKITGDIYAAIFILACLHENGYPVVCELSNSSDSTIRSVYSQLPDEDFKFIVSEFLYQINRDTLEKWFNEVDTNSYITKKKVDEVKNDSPPETTTGS